MRRRSLQLALLVAGVLAGISYKEMTRARIVAPEPEQVTTAQLVASRWSPPYGFVSFCSREPTECAVRAGAADFRVTLGRVSQLRQVNRSANKRIEPATDLEIYGVDEWWAIPTTKGDCEDYALLKRHLLIEKGWPSSRLLLAVVLDKGAGHVVLIARALGEDLVLDNKANTIRPRDETPYVFVQRQSESDPTAWVPMARPVMTAADVLGEE